MKISIPPKSYHVFLFNSYLLPYYVPPWPEATTDLLSVTIDSFEISRILYRQNNTVCYLFCLDSFIYHNYFEIHSCCQVPYFIAEWYSIVWTYCNLFIHLPISKHLSSVQFRMI